MPCRLQFGLTCCDGWIIRALALHWLLNCHERELTAVSLSIYSLSII